MNYCALALAVALTATMRVAPPSLADAARGAGENVRLQLLECAAARTMGREVAPRVENQWKWRLLGFILPGAGSLHALAARAEPQNTIALENMTDEAVGVLCGWLPIRSSGVEELVGNGRRGRRDRVGFLGSGGRELIVCRAGDAWRTRFLLGSSHDSHPIGLAGRGQPAGFNTGRWPRKR